MVDITARELRTNLIQVLRRVVAGERLRVTASGKPVAQLVPLDRLEEMPLKQFLSSLNDVRADAALADEVRVLLPDRTDDLPL